MHSFVLTLIGRPNVGKSALFNRIASRPKAIVHKNFGVTRDQNILNVQWQNISFDLCDTAGIVSFAKDDLTIKTNQLSLVAANFAKALIFVVDRKDGILYEDKMIFSALRKLAKPVFVAVNKVDDHLHANDVSEFFSLGVDKLYPVSALHNIGVQSLIEDIIEFFKLTPSAKNTATQLFDEVTTTLAKPNPRRYTQKGMPIITILGKPNVGKSTLANRFIGKDRLLVTNKAGTTRDSIDVIFKHNTKRIMLIDTAGMRRKLKVSSDFEKLSLKSAVTSIRLADVCILVLDAALGYSFQDSKLFSLIIKNHKSLIIAINKWDKVDKDSLSVEKYRQNFYNENPYLKNVEIMFISGLKGQRTSLLLSKVLLLHAERGKKISAPSINKLIFYINSNQQVDVNKKIALKIKYGVQIGINPPAFSFYVNSVNLVSKEFEKYVDGLIRKFFEFSSTPIKIFWRSKYSKKASEYFTKSQSKSNRSYYR